MARFRRGRCDSPAEEFGCPWCGCPIYVGDFYTLTPDDEGYCSAHCALKAEARSADHQAVEARVR